MSDGTPSRRRRLTKTHKRLLTGGGSIAVAVAVFVFVLPQFANYRDVLAVVSDLSWQQWLALAGAVVLNLATFPPPWMAALPGLGFRRALVMTQASTALSIVSPAGAAVGMAASYSMLRSWRFEAGAVGLAVAIAGIWNQLVNLAFPVVALALLTAADQDHPALRTAALVGLAVLGVAVTAFGLVLSRAERAWKIGDLAARLANRLVRVVRRGPVTWGAASFARFRSQALGLLRRRWHVLTIATLAGHLTVFVLLLVCLRVTGITESEVTVTEAFAAWALVRVLGALPLTPAGVGFVEVGLTGALVAFGASNAEAVAATLLYRALTVLPTLALGLLAAATWRTHHPGESVGSPSDP
ncbi:MAG TPA: lysylphosphatidylglycerol synthase transmembrane domain-containing protein [Gaiellaceae bacterium]|nr:lysylphosphatidylglycerol synthase transmembrane domain-containing protein [Gaiellaceae bacterium]